MEWNKTRKNIIKIYAVTLTIGLIYYLIIRLTGWGFPCFYYETTGFLCPGCGISRMFLCLLQGDIPGAFSYHPVGMVLLPLWVGFSLFLFWGKPKFLQKPAFLFTALGITLGVLLLFCVVRNGWL